MGDAVRSHSCALAGLSSCRGWCQLMAETLRVVRVGGAALFYAWALEQEDGGVSGHRYLAPSC